MFPEFLENTVIHERNLRDKSHLEGEIQNTVFPYPAYRLLLTAYPLLLPLTSTLIPASFRPQHLYFAAAPLNGSTQTRLEGVSLPRRSAELTTKPANPERVASQGIEAKGQGCSLMKNRICRIIKKSLFLFNPPPEFCPMHLLLLAGRLGGDRA